MSTILEIGGYQALISDEPDNGFFRGEFLGLKGGAEFYAPDLEKIRQEGEASLRVFLKMCSEDEVDPNLEFSGKIELSVSPDLHERLAFLAEVSGKSLQEWIREVLQQRADMERESFKQLLKSIRT
ncbi:MAG: type II toxin-antitoxin system HicB family antitoxin [Desulfohalobiaceae bacterium]|nr:type II toxin-antitoxin system HicB family antitoxin [Desulfohalobiaceae bacterium]